MRLVTLVEISKAKRCGAMTRKGTPCRRLELFRGGKCRNHGGLSTGPRTEEGKRKSIKALRDGLERWRKRRRAEKAVIGNEGQREAGDEGPKDGH